MSIGTEWEGIAHAEVKQKEPNKTLYTISKSITWRDVAGDETEVCEALQERS